MKLYIHLLLIGLLICSNTRAAEPTTPPPPDSGSTEVPPPDSGTTEPAPAPTDSGTTEPAPTDSGSTKPPPDTESAEVPTDTDGKPPPDTDSGEVPTDGDPPPDTDSGEVPTDGDPPPDTDSGEAPTNGDPPPDTDSGEVPTNGDPPPDKDSGEAPTNGDPPPDTDSGEAPTDGDPPPDKDSGEAPTDGDPPPDKDSDSTDKPAPTDSGSTEPPPPPPEDPKLQEDNIGKMSANELSTIEPKAFVHLKSTEIKKMPPDAFTGITPEQLSNMTRDTVTGIKVTQFEQIPTDTLGGFTSNNMGGLSTEVIANLVPTQLNALDVNEFKQMPGKEVSKLFTHFDAEKVNPSDVETLLPENWQVDLNTGALTAPNGTELTLQSMQTTSSSVKVKLPTVPNLNMGFGVGGGGTSLIDGTLNSLNTSIKTVNVKENFELSQNQQGILSAKGVKQFKDIKYTFIPDINNAIQVDTDKIPVGSSTGAGGFPLVTTPEGLQYRVIPAPHDPSGLSESLGGGEVVVGEQGDVLMELSPNTQSDNTMQVVLMESLVESAIDNSCVEMNTGIVSCDDGVRKVVYSDGSTQAFNPTLLSPDVFIEEALKIDGVKRVIFNEDGTFYAFYQGSSFLVRPNFDVKTETIESDETIAASITLDYKGGLRYTIPIDDDEITLRGGARRTMIFDPFIEPAPEEICVESDDGKVICEFD